jgi:hypothetical protein
MRKTDGHESRTRLRAEALQRAGTDTLFLSGLDNDGLQVFPEIVRPGDNGKDQRNP